MQLVNVVKTLEKSLVMNNMRVVEFNNGKFAIERGLFFKEYRGKCALYWWGRSDQVKKYCLFDTKKEADKALRENDFRVKRVFNNPSFLGASRQEIRDEDTLPKRRLAYLV